MTVKWAHLFPTAWTVTSCLELEIGYEEIICTMKTGFLFVSLVCFVLRGRGVVYLTRWLTHNLLLFSHPLCPSLCGPVNCTTPLSSIMSQSSLRFVSVVSVMLTNRPILSHLLLLYLQSFPASSGSFPVSQLFTSGGQSIWASTLASVLPVNIQGWFPLGWTGLISLQAKGLSKVISNTTVQKHQFFGAQPSLWSNSHIHTWLLEKPQLWLDRPLLAK